MITTMVIGLKQSLIVFPCVMSSKGLYADQNLYLSEINIF